MDKKHFLNVFLMLTLCSLAGCAVGPDFKRPAAPTLTSYTSSGDPSSIQGNAKSLQGEEQHLSQNKVESQWWKLYQSKELDGLIEEALAHNQNLDSLQHTLKSAMQGALAQERSLLLPSINANLTDTKERFNPESFGSSTPPTIFSLTNASIGMSYTLDLFGGIRRQVETSYAQAQNQEYLYQGARITLIANVVTTAVRRAAVKRQITLTQAMLVEQKQLLSITQQRHESGALSAYEVEQSQEALAQLEATLPSLENQYSALGDQLAVYLGRFPSASALTDIDLEKITLPKELPLSVPSQLIHQRPDILASEALLHAATAQVGVALSGEYPNITINASYGSMAANPNGVFSANSAVWSLSSGIVQPLFHGGALEAQTEATREQLRSSASQYQQTVLNAFQNVADAISTLKTDGQLLDRNYRVTHAADQQKELIKTQYETGSSSYLQYLTAQLHEQQTELTLIQVRAARLNDTAAFFLSLGGGWNDGSNQQANN